MKIFSKEKFIQVEGERSYLFNKSWVDICDGREVTGHSIGMFQIEDKWCVITIEEKNKTKYEE